jgi:hypothetical protein
MTSPDRSRSLRADLTTAGIVAVAVGLLFVAASCGGAGPELGASATSTPAEVPTPTVAPAETNPEPTAATPGADADPTPSPTSTPTPAPGTPRPTATPADVSGPPAFTSASKLTTAGLDEVFFGDTVDAAAERVGTTWVGVPAPGAEPLCYTIQAAGEPRGVVFTVSSGHIERVDVTTDIITTRSGAGVGSTPAELAALFPGRLETNTVVGGTEIVFVPESEADQAYRIIWTTDGTAVVAMRAGRVPVVDPATPCS